MKNQILASVAAISLTQSLMAAVINSAELNERVFRERDYSSNSKKFPVDVDMDGSNDLLIYIDYYASSGTPIERLIYVRTEANTSVSAVRIPFPGDSILAFTTVSEGTAIGDSFVEPIQEWASGDLQFHGYTIAGGIPSRDSYLAVRIEKESNIVYGWVRLIFPISNDYVSETGYVKIKESAIQTSHETEIAAGQGKIELLSEYQSTIDMVGPSDFDLEVKGVDGLVCTLQESSDLTRWTTTSIQYSASENHSLNRSTSDSPIFYRWRLSESLEEMD